MIEWPALFLSLKVAAASSALLALGGLPLTFWLSRQTRPRWLLLETIFALPLVVPPTVLGFYLLLALGPLGFAFSFSGLVIASVIAGIPLALQSFLVAFRGIEKKYFENASLLGATGMGVFFRVALPLAKEGILSGLILSFAHALGEFGVVLMIGGNIPGVSRTLSIALYDEVVGFNFAAANRTAGVLVFFSLASLAGVALLKARGRHR